MPLSAQDALRQAKTEIEYARKSRSSRLIIIKHYRSTKKILDEVDVARADAGTLREMITAFLDFTAILDHLGDNQRADKCRRRADALSYYLSLVGPGFSQAIVQAGIAYWSSLASSSRIVALVAATSTSTESVINTVSASRQPTPPPAGQPTLLPLQAASSLSAAGSTSATSPLFSTNVNPVPFVCRLPELGEPFQTTIQLAYGLAVVHPSVQENDLSPEALQWRHSTLNNRDEKGRLETISLRVIEAFAKDTMKDANAVAEVVQLTPVINKDHSRFLLKVLIDTINQSEILHLHSLEGLAKAIKGAASGSIDSDDLLAILRSLHKRLRSTHSASQHNQLLLIAVSRVLDAMADAHIGDVDRIDLHEPLKDFLQESESVENPYMAFQIQYAMQALINVSDDESIWHAGFRRVWLVLKGGAGLAKIADPTEIKDTLEGLETLYEAGKGGIRFFKDALKAIKDRENPTFTVKEGLKFKRAWYRAVRIAESYLQSGRLIQFEALVTTAPCRHQLMFQWGICQLLEQFIADPQWDLEARKGAVEFLGALYKDNSIWKRHKEVNLVIFDALTNIVSNNEAVKSLLEEMRKQNPGLKPFANVQSPPWNNTRPGNPTEHATPTITLLKAVQERNTRHAKLESMTEAPTRPRVDDIDSVLRAYHAPDLVILRVSRNELDLETCFVNLAIVVAPEHRKKEKEDLKKRAAVFHRISSVEKVEKHRYAGIDPSGRTFRRTPIARSKEGHPKKNFVWIPLRQLRGLRSRTLEGLFCEKVFVAQNREDRQVALAQALVISAESGKVLFILDGLDEIVTDTEGAEAKTFKSFLKALLEQQHVVITSRPSGVDSKLLPPIDLELETIGFSQQNVNDFLDKVLEPDASKTVQDFIQRTPLIQGLVNIPVQLDVICFSWISLPTDSTAVTMTGLYQLMVRKLWCKDALRLKKTIGGKALTEQHVNRFTPRKIDGLMATELQHLGYLAFKGMKNKHQIEFDEDALLSAFEDLEDNTEDNQQISPPQALEDMKQTSFLHTADVGVGGNGDPQQAWYFLHLTFQEYFAATWIVRHFNHRQIHSKAGMMTKDQATEFVHQNKYNPQYEIVWSMVVGLLEGEPLEDFFGLFQGEPRDLIGGRHQQILASCLNEARTQLNSSAVVDLDTELRNWLRFEMQTCQHEYYSRSMLGSQIAFPDVSLVETLSSVPSWMATLIQTLEVRSVLSQSAVDFLITALKNEDYDVRNLAESELCKRTSLNEPAIQSLIAALMDDDWGVRSSAKSILGNQSTLTESAIESLLAVLKDDDWGVRSSVQSVFGKQSMLSGRAVQSFIAALTDDDWRVRSSAASALALKADYWKVRSSAVSILGTQSTLKGSAIQSLIAALKDENDDVRSSAASALGNQSTLTDSAIQSLVAALNDENWGVGSLAASILGKQSTLTEPAIQSLIAALANDNWKVFGSVTVSKQSTLSESAVRSLIVLLKNDDCRVRSSAVLILVTQSTLTGPVIKSLIAALMNDGWGVRSSAALALGKQTRLTDSAIRSLNAALKCCHWKVRFSVATALGNRSMLTVPVIQSLFAAIKDDDWRVRSSAQLALEKQSKLTESAIQSLIVALKDEAEDVRSLAQSLLAKQSTLSESAIQSLIAALKDDDWRVRYSVQLVLENQSMLSESVIQSLIGALKDEVREVRSSAASILGKQSILTESVIGSLTVALGDDYWKVRSLAVSILGAQPMWTGSVLQSVVAALEDEDQDVRSSAASALGKQSTLPESVTQSLISALQDDHWKIRTSAQLALENQTALTESAVQRLIAALEHDVKDVHVAAETIIAKQSTLTRSVIQSLVAALRHDEQRVRDLAFHILQSQFASTGHALLYLTEEETASQYERHLFSYSCGRVLSFQVRPNGLYFYTEQGALHVELNDQERLDVISSAFRSVQQRFGLIP
ncbi:hypothetical protein EMPS_04093 [Entomortierella parvispora]|uniref:NACHT domain-containing protein n=1 Tax=Entomortierella parvispora TaxID=205924 RepID=A0A9P3H7V0_9FUNG|nr:hypothetical protein EMPS_04093 [Entomortierella parvispora]